MQTPAWVEEHMSWTFPEGVEAFNKITPLEEFRAGRCLYQREVKMCMTLELEPSETRTDNMKIGESVRIWSASHQEETFRRAREDKLRGVKTVEELVTPTILRHRVVEDQETESGRSDGFYWSEASWPRGSCEHQTMIWPPKRFETEKVKGRLRTAGLVEPERLKKGQMCSFIYRGTAAGEVNKFKEVEAISCEFVPSACITTTLPYSAKLWAMSKQSNGPPQKRAFWISRTSDASYQLEDGSWLDANDKVIENYLPFELRGVDKHDLGWGSDTAETLDQAMERGYATKPHLADFVLRNLSGAKDSIRMFCYCADYEPGFNVLKARCGAGVRVRMIFDAEQFWSSYSSCRRQFCRCREALEADIEIRTLRPVSAKGAPAMHSKGLILDGSTALIGSANFTENGLIHSEEQICRIDSAAQVDAIVAHWEKAWRESRPVTIAEMDAVAERRAAYSGSKKQTIKALNLEPGKGAVPANRS